MSDKNKFQPSKKLVKADGTIAWVWEGKLHNMEEAPLIHPNGKKEYHIHGIQYSHDDWKERRRNCSTFTEINIALRHQRTSERFTICSGEITETIRKL